MSDLLTTFPSKDGRLYPAVWADKSGVLHSAVGADVHPGVRLLWTACERHDIPANSAHLKLPAESVTCPACAALSSPTRPIEG